VFRVAPALMDSNNVLVKSAPVSVGCRVEGWGCKVLGFGFRASGFGFKVSGLRCPVSVEVSLLRVSWSVLDYRDGSAPPERHPQTLNPKTRPSTLNAKPYAPL